MEFRNLFGAGHNLSIAKFAWSPDGRKFVFRSQAGSKCNYMALRVQNRNRALPLHLQLEPINRGRRWFACE